MQAVILAGGKGTRLKELTAEIPKPMVEIDGTPIIEHQIGLLKKQGVLNILVIVNHLKQPLIDHLKNGDDLGVNISYFEENSPLGTAGAFPLIAEDLEETFLVIYGDVMFDMDINRLLDFHTNNTADATLVIHPNDHPYDSDLVEIDSSNRIIEFHSKPHSEGAYYKNLVNAGVYVFNKAVLKELPGAVKGDFGKDIFPLWVKKMNILGYNTPEYLKDMGTLDRLSKVTNDFTSGKIARRNLTNKQKAIFLDRDGVLNEDRHLIHTTNELILYPETAGAVKKINNSDYLSIVVTNQSVVARNLCSIEELEYIHKKLDSNLGEKGAKLDQLYYCPYHPDKGYPEENPLYKREHPWRKPSPGMLKQAENDFNLDLSESFMIGDRESDILAGKRAGCHTIAVRTGHGYKNAIEQPDYFFNNLDTAVDYILNDPFLSQCDKIIGQLEIKENHPTVVLVGGNSQSGKSTFAKRLSLRLSEKKLPNQTLALDDFLIPSEERKSSKSVFDRYDLDKIESSVQDLLAGKEISINRYFKEPGTERLLVDSKLTNEKVLIIEGVVALKNEKLRALSSSCIFIDQPIEQFKERFNDLYKWKGFSSNEIDELYSNRAIDEFEQIVETKKFADLII